MNIVPQIAKALGVELEEEFKVSNVKDCVFKFTKNNFVCPNGRGRFKNDDFHQVFEDLVHGDAEIIKIPWKPKKGEIYRYVWGEKDTLEIGVAEWEDGISDYCYFISKNCFRTTAQAEASRQSVWERLNKEVEKC